jgi:hypothetical protein
MIWVYSVQKSQGVGAAMKQQRGFWLQISLALLFLAYPRNIVGKTAPCGLEELKASFPSERPSYPDAIALSDTLKKYGISVKCILTSKMEGMFEGRQDAALYRTDQGEFDVLFLPQPKTFDQLRVIERQDGQRYLYSFQGPPQPWSANLIDSAFPMYFVKHENTLLVLQDKQLAATLALWAFPLPQQRGVSKIADCCD